MRLHAEWRSWQTRRSAASAWMAKPTSSCPVLTASVRNASTNGKLRFSWNPWKVFTIQHAPLILQEWAEPKLPNMPSASDRCQRLVGDVGFPHGAGRGPIHPQPGWRGRSPSQALTQSQPVWRSYGKAAQRAHLTRWNTESHFHCENTVPGEKHQETAAGFHALFSH